MNLAKLLYDYFKQMKASHKISSTEGFKEESFHKKEGKIKAHFLCNKVFITCIYIYTHTSKSMTYNASFEYVESVEKDIVARYAECGCKEDGRFFWKDLRDFGESYRIAFSQFHHHEMSLGNENY